MHLNGQKNPSQKRFMEFLKPLHPNVKWDPEKD
jgi:hypothetical protein